MPTNKPRYCITVDDDTLSQIDQFCQENHFASRSQGTVELIRLGLQSMKEQNVPQEQK